jgi:hypothetical protein
MSWMPYSASMFCFPSRRYTIEIFIWMSIYIGLLYFSIAVLRNHAVTSQSVHVIVALLPVVPLFGVLNLSMRRFRQADELQKKIISEGIMFGFGLTAIVTLSYGFLQLNADAPPISFVWVWPLLASGWVVGQILARFRYQ